MNQLRRTLTPALPRAKIKTLLADAGYDSEMNHEFAREACGIETIIPAWAGRPTVSLPKGKYRRQMRLSFDRETYGQRWQVETVFRMIKRNLGSALRSRSYGAQCRELLLLTITHNLTILMAVELFYRAALSPLSFFLRSHHPLIIHLVLSARWMAASRWTSGKNRTISNTNKEKRDD